MATKKQEAVMKDILGHVLQIGDTVAVDTVGQQDLAVGKIVRIGTKKIVVEQSVGLDGKWTRNHTKYPTQAVLIRGDAEGVSFTEEQVTEFRNQMLESCIAIADRHGATPEAIEEMLSLKL